MNERPTFSPIWHRVRLSKPRLRSHVDITRQHYRGRRWHVVHDPTSNQFFRLNPIAYDLIATLDGTRDVETAWQAALTKFGDSAPTQNEVVNLIGQLYNANLLALDATPETEQLLRRGRDRRTRKAVTQAIGIMSFKVRLLNPDRILSAAEPVLRWALNGWGFLAWCALMVYAITQLVPHAPKLVSGVDSVIAPANLWLLPIVFVITKLWHEFGHGVICKRFGGQVPEFGVMMLVLFPSPFVDASSAWAFSSKWQRIAVGAGGMLFELFLAAISALVWVWAQENGRSGEVVAQLAYNIMFTSGVATVFFNANPLMRFDGYYILADLLETPNLAQRSAKMLQHLVQRFVFRLENLTPPTSLAGERAILLVYGVLSLAYRIALFIGITLYILGFAFGVGVVLAVWSVAAWFILPTGKYLHWLATSPALGEHRARTVAISVALAIAGVLIVGVVPLPDRRQTLGVVESVQRTGVYTGSEGFVTAALKRPGDRVQAGEIIATMESPDLTIKRLGLLAQLEEYLAQARAAVKDNETGSAQLAQDRARIVRENIKDFDERLSALTIRAPHEGTIVSGDPASRVGAYLKRGVQLCEVVDTSRLRVAATLDQRQAAWLFDHKLDPSDGSLGETSGPGNAISSSTSSSSSSSAIAFDADVRMLSNVDHVIHASRVEVVPAGQRALPSAALGHMGGGQVEIETKDESGRLTRRPQFTVRLTPEAPEEFVLRASPGERVRVRFKLEPRAMLSQWLDHLRAEVQGRVKL